MKKIIVISDVDGCLTDGKYTYTVDGKVSKVYGPHDNDGVKLLRKNGIEVRFISADKRGFDITNKRITDMKCQLDYVSEADRPGYIAKACEEYNVIFFGDGLGDLAAAMANPSAYFIAPKNARRQVKDYADYVTSNIGGEGAFLDLAEYVVSIPRFVQLDAVVNLY
jgi:3-deoxy-D-manno-octulosonate 8-phosphate phosphatase (KDO 8-P phosphatase)